MDLQKLEDSDHRYTGQAVELLKHVENIDLEEMEEFIAKKFFVIGGSHILAYFKWRSEIEQLSTEKQVPSKNLRRTYLDKLHDHPY